jgi:hypothetical protein
VSTPYPERREHSPVTDHDPLLTIEALIPATQKQYMTWVGGYLMNGGPAYFIEEDEPNLDTSEEILFAIEPFTLHGEDKRHGARKIIVADGIEWTGDVGDNTLYLFQDFQLIGDSPTVVAVPELADLGDGLKCSFMASFKGSVKTFSNPGIMDQDDEEIYGRNLRDTIAKYSRMAAVLQLEIDPAEQGEILRVAAQERAEILKTMGPHYRDEQMSAAFHAIRAAMLTAGS